MRIPALVVPIALLLAGCGSDGGTSVEPQSSSNQYVTVQSVSVGASQASLSGTAWVSKSWVGLHCAGLACLSDTSTNNYPGVDVICSNLTNGSTATATQRFGGGTDWENLWSCSVPLAPGPNAVQLSAFDPGGKGGTLTITINQ